MPSFATEMACGCFLPITTKGILFTFISIIVMTIVAVVIAIVWFLLWAIGLGT